MSLNEFVSAVKEEIFSRILSEQEGEMDIDVYTEKMYDVLYEEIDKAITNEYLGDVEKLVCEYGIHKALCLIKNRHGSISIIENVIQEEGQYSRCMLYHIVFEQITYSYEEYKVWCKCECSCCGNDIDD
jgi:hypothetical protein